MSKSYKQSYNKQYKCLCQYMDENYPEWRKDKAVVNKIKKTARKIAKGSGINNAIGYNFLNLLNKIGKKKVERTNIKSIPVKKEDFEDWPFVPDSGIIKQSNNLFVTIVFEGKEYSLNGAAKDSLELKFPYEDNLQIIGKDVGPFIQIGLNL